MISKKKVFRSIYGESLSFCKCRRARIKEPASRIGPAGRSLSISALGVNVEKTDISTAHELAAKCNFNPAAKSGKPPAIIARFMNRDVRTEMETGRVEILRPAGGKPVKFCFFATKIRPNINQNILYIPMCMF